ncbi:helix-hairpin-helix domain-containing protein [Kitasatospora sp. NPDC059327]|uniref:helix-hairpin-helix domain-containing protein n=1 Tax=Kitasatospora sp. NPDC059327 TaxID=3346803 RepID=UPI00367A0B72
MTNMSIGAVKRQRVGEVARRRLATLLPAAEETAEEVTDVRAGAAEPSATGPPPGAVSVGDLPGGLTPGVPRGVAGAVGAARPGGAVGTVEPEGVPPDGAGSAGPVRARWRLGTSTLLDRRAVLGLVVLLLLTVGYGVQHFWLARPRPVAVPTVAVGPMEPGQPGPGQEVPGPPEAGPAGTPPAPDDAGPHTVVVVDIGGRVHTPGVHALPSGSRVADALRVAGGPLPETETKSLNLARVLTDGEQILVGEPGPVPATGAVGGPVGAGATGPRQPVSLNHATLEQLDTLPGVGPTLAQRIIAFRASHGSFRSLDQLRQVSGIGERTYAEIRPMLAL